MKILADKNIPLLKYFFSNFVESIDTVSPDKFYQKNLLQYDILLIRSTIKISSDILKNARPKIIASCVSGSDHMDLDYLKKESIMYYTASGCNSQSVSSYVKQIINGLINKSLLRHNGKIAIIGVGNIGKKIVKFLQKKNYEIVQCDPFRAIKESKFPHIPIEYITNCDMICLHIPLTFDGKFPTYHIISECFLKKQLLNTIIINTSRGNIIHPNVFFSSQKFIFCFDVWPKEPNIPVDLVQKSYIATPHIAGYTKLGISKGVHMAYNKMSNIFHWPKKDLPNNFKKNIHKNLFQLSNSFKLNIKMKKKTEYIFKKFRKQYMNFS